MSYKEEMTRHLQAAKVMDAEVDRFEHWASEVIEDRHAHELAEARSPGNRESIKLQKMSKLLEGEPAYGNRAKVRDYHMRWAQLYAAVIVAEEVTCE